PREHATTPRPPARGLCPRPGWLRRHRRGNPDATPPAVASPEPTATTAAPTPTPTGEALADGTCAQLHAAVQGAKALAPEREPVLAALEAVTADVPAELADELGTVEEEVRAHLDEVVATEGFVDPVELDVPADLAAACAA